MCDGKGVCKGRDLCVNVKCPIPANSCTVLTCVSGTGKCISSNKKPNTSCDDDNPDTTGDKCLINNGKIECKGINKCANVKCKAKQCFGTPKCNPKTGACSLGPIKPVGQSCDDGNQLTKNDKCGPKGVCTGEKIQSCVIITGIGSLTGMKGFVELFTTCDVPDLSLYGIGSANNGKGTDGKEFGFDNRKLAKGSFFYISANPDKFKSFFGFAPDFKYT